MQQRNQALARGPTFESFRYPVANPRRLSAEILRRLVTRGWSTQPSCAPERTERGLDFLFGRYPAALGLIDRRKLLRRGVVHTAAARLDCARVLGKLFLILLGPELNLLKYSFRARAHAINIAWSLFRATRRTLQEAAINASLPGEARIARLNGKGWEEA